MITTQIDDRELVVFIDQLLSRVENFEPALREIGEDLTESVKLRFASTTAPDGSPWAPNKQSTIDAYLGQYAGSFKKDGSQSKKGAARSAAKKPLTGETKALGTTIHYVLDSGNDAVAVGSALPYAAMANFGGTKAAFPQLWGDIPARIFLGMSETDAANVMGTLERHLFGA